MEPIFFVHTPTGDISVYPDKVVRKVGLFQASGSVNPRGELTIPMNEILEVEVFENKFGQRSLTFKTLKFLKIAAGTEKLEKKVAVNVQWFAKKQHPEADQIKEYIDKAIAARTAK